MCNLLLEGTRFPVQCVILEPSSCSSSATVSASCRGDLCGLASLWLSVIQSGASAARYGACRPGEKFLDFAIKVCQHSRADLTLPSFRLKEAGCLIDLVRSFFHVYHPNLLLTQSY